MAQQSPHPTVLSPNSRFAAEKYSNQSRSPSRSPIRRDFIASHEIDPLVSNLSPISTLEALRATDAIPPAPGSRQQVLSDSIADASTSERALAIRAALAGKKLREWYAEVKVWRWPKSAFEEPSQEERLKTHITFDHRGYLDQVIYGGTGAVRADEVEQQGSLGSLPAYIVGSYERRIETIKDEMEELDVEELKNYVLGAHLSRNTALREEQYTDPSLGAYSHLDDFTVVITATIMQALPYIARLTSLLDVWSIRLVVLRQVPGFLRQLEDARIAVDSAWNAIGIAKGAASEDQSDLTREDFSTMKGVLQDRVAELGQRLDTMLDALEGSVDRLPDYWIDSMEGVQDDYEMWVVDAERQVEKHECRLQYVASMQAKQEGEIQSQSQVLETRPPIAENYGQQNTNGHTSTIQQIGSPNPSLDGPSDMTDPHLAGRNTGEHQSAHTNDVEQPTSNIVAVSANGHLSDLPFRDQHGSSPRSAGGRTVSFDEPLQPQETIGVDGQAEHFSLPGRRSPSHRPPPLELSKQIATADSSVLSDDTSNHDSPSSDYFSNMSSPEILDASRVEYFKTPTEDKPVFFVARDVGSADDAISRQPSQRTERSSGTVKEAQGTSEPTSPIARSRASSFLPEATIFEDMPKPLVESTESGNMGPGLGLKRASVTSIEVLSRSELRNITVRRSGSPLSTSSGLSNGMPSLTRTSTDEDASPPLQMSNQRQTLENGSRDNSLASPLPLPPQTPEKLEFQVEEVSDSTPTRPEQVKQSPPSKRAREVYSPSRSRFSPTQSLEDQLTARISSILTNIPAHIRLASGPEADAPEVALSEEQTAAKQAGATTQALHPPRPRSATPSITLAPAFSKTSKSKSHNNDSDIKLYHLHQPGKDAPIKLYVRLVGENGERVMVRVGGGWADLGEYLKEYASHHGRRSISDGRFEIKGLAPGQGSATLATLAGRSSGRTTPISRPESPVAGPNTSVGMRKVRLSSGSIADSRAPVTPEVQIRSYDAVPGSGESPARSARSSSVSWIDEDTPLGMAGPKSKKEVSPSKKAWVDGMLDQARKASAEKRRAVSDFGDLGKVGATRRIFLKNKSEA
ncbi:hypothetical protein MMC30_005485 [Trapelia coarctata]|nr:hypothetical protein [Trapelia coarctata]